MKNYIVPYAFLATSVLLSYKFSIFGGICGSVALVWLGYKHYELEKND